MEISSATLSDQVCLSAHIRSLYRDRYKCEEKAKELKARHNVDDAYIANWRKSRGCSAVTRHLVDRIGNIEYYTCLCNFKHPLTHLLLSMSKHYEHGVLPFSGGLLEQPSQVIELLEIVQSAKIEEDIEMQRKEASKWRKK